MSLCYFSVAALGEFLPNCVHGCTRETRDVKEPQVALCPPPVPTTETNLLAITMACQNTKAMGSSQPT